MDSILFPNNMEIDYRNSHYKSAQDALNGVIWCAICNSDLKHSIIVSDSIMLHNKFLCLCCKNCFEKLSHSQNGCIFCSSNTSLKTCQTCISKMCQKCIDSHYPKLQHSGKLKSCLGCSLSVLWNLRSQAAAVLKCFSLELGARLLLNGEESEGKENVRKFLINEAQFNSNITQEDIHRIRIKYLFHLFNLNVKPIFDGCQKLKIKNIEQDVTNFGELCEYILVSTCSVLRDFKGFFNDESVESLNIKVKSLLTNGVLFKKNENNCNKRIKYSHIKNVLNNTKNKSVHHNSLGLQKHCYVSLEKLDEEIIKAYFIKKEKSDAIIKNGNFNTANSTNKVQTDYQTNSFDLTYQTNSEKSKQNDSFQKLLMNMKEFEIRLIKLDEQTIKHYTRKNYKAKLYSEMNSQNTENNAVTTMKSLSKKHKYGNLENRECHVILEAMDTVTKYANHHREKCKSDTDEPKIKVNNKKQFKRKLGPTNPYTFRHKKFKKAH